MTDSCTRVRSSSLCSSCGYYFNVALVTILLLLALLSYQNDDVLLVHWRRGTPSSLGNASVYVPGAGFSGFWYHLGLFQSMSQETMHQYEYYCYSSACLSVILGFLQTSAEEAYHACQSIQQEWYQGELSTYAMVDEFLHRLVPLDESKLTPWLSRMHIISTNLAKGVDIQQPTNRDELVQLVRQTTWIPFLTGSAWQLPGPDQSSCSSHTFECPLTGTSKNYYLDGYFSVPWHPECRYTASVPFAWDLYLHSLNPAVGRNSVFEFVQHGQNQTKPFQMNLKWNATR